jgi:excisionase family DNA binding protein
MRIGGGQGYMARKGNAPASRQAADLLGAHVETIRRLARKGEIPSYKIGKDWRFRRDALLRWVETHYLRRRAPHVLIVDDEELVRDLCRRVLEREGCRVATASDGEEGLRYTANGVPDLVLLDLKMPGTNGAEFLDGFRAENPHTPVMIITGYPDSDLMTQAMRYGPVTLLAKPLEEDHLVRSVRVALKGRSQGSARREHGRDKARNRKIHLFEFCRPHCRGQGHRMTLPSHLLLGYSHER